MLLFGALFLLLSLSGGSQSCVPQSQSLSVSAEEIQRTVEGLVQSQSAIEYECLRFLLERVFYEQAGYLYDNYFAKHQIDISDQVRADTSFIKRGLDSLNQHFLSSQQKPQIVAPAISWAQSKSRVFIQVSDSTTRAR